MVTGLKTDLNLSNPIAARLSIKWKGCFQWVERLLPMGGKTASNGWKHGFRWVETKQADTPTPLLFTKPPSRLHSPVNGWKTIGYG